MPHYPDDSPRLSLWQRFCVRWNWRDEALSDVQADVIVIRTGLAGINRKLDLIGVAMSAASDKLDRIDVATTAVGSELRALKDELANQSDASPEVLDRLERAAVALESIDSNPDNPVPPVPGEDDGSGTPDVGNE